jgi:hypothetical protein
MLNILTLLTLKMLLLQWKISMPSPAATSNLDGNRTFQQHKKGKLIH